jgi:hypothetical protein
MVYQELHLQRSPELTRGCSPEVDHPEFPPMTRASVDAHEASLPYLSSLVCAGPARRRSPARLFGHGVSDRAARTDAGVLASTIGTNDALPERLSRHGLAADERRTDCQGRPAAATTRQPSDRQ